jgi:hypothetical protein
MFFVILTGNLACAFIQIESTYEIRESVMKGYLTPKQSAKKLQLEFKAGKKIGCVPTIIGQTVFDQYECSCGWKSPGYHDKRDLSHRYWVKHIQEKGATIVYSKDILAVIEFNIKNRA